VKIKELKIAKKAAWAAGKIIRQHYEKDFAIRHKGSINLVTEVDLKAQDKIEKIIRKAYPKDYILGEEGPQTERVRATRRWIVDPLDGTTNFAHGYPHFCVSIAFEKNRKIEVGVIYDPMRDETFWAVRGKAAYCDERQIHTSAADQLRSALLVTGFPYNLYRPETNNLLLFNHMIFKAQAIRRDGTAALDLAYVACGRFDGFWELGLCAWDVAAGMLIVKEAGGICIDLQPRNQHELLPSALIAGNPQIADSLHEEVKKIWAFQSSPKKKKSKK